MNIAEEMALIGKGTHFWCSGHLGAMPVIEQSTNKHYCQRCYVYMVAERRLNSRQRGYVPNLGVVEAK